MGSDGFQISDSTTPKTICNLLTIQTFRLSPNASKAATHGRFKTRHGSFVYVDTGNLPSALRGKGAAHVVGCPPAMIKRLLEQGQAAQIGMGEVNSAIRLPRRRPGTAPDKTRPRTNHGMAPAHYIQALGQGTNIGMGAGQIGEHQVRAALPVEAKQASPGLAWIGITKGIVIGENGRPVIQAALMRGGNVAQGRAFVKHVVPRQRKPTTVWPTLQEQVGHQPSAVLKGGQGLGWRLAIGTNRTSRD